MRAHPVRKITSSSWKCLIKLRWQMSNRFQEGKHMKGYIEMYIDGFIITLLLHVPCCHKCLSFILLATSTKNESTETELKSLFHSESVPQTVRIWILLKEHSVWSWGNLKFPKKEPKTLWRTYTFWWESKGSSTLIIECFLRLCVSWFSDGHECKPFRKGFFHEPFLVMTTYWSLTQVSTYNELHVRLCPNGNPRI